MGRVGRRGVEDCTPGCYRLVFLLNEGRNSENFAKANAKVKENIDKKSLYNFFLLKVY